MQNKRTVNAILAQRKSFFFQFGIRQVQIFRDQSTFADFSLKNAENWLKTVFFWKAGAAGGGTTTTFTSQGPPKNSGTKLGSM